VLALKLRIFMSFVKMPPGIRTPLAPEKDTIRGGGDKVERDRRLLTWNCKHIANAQVLRSVVRTCREHGYEPPVICTPEELMGA
jgi:hypothetical protein